MKTVLYTWIFLLLASLPSWASEPEKPAKPLSAVVQRELAINLLFWQGIAAKEQGQIALAASAFRTLLSAEPNHFPARRALADCLALLDDIPAAEHHLRLLLKTDPDPRWQKLYSGALGKLITEKPFRVGGSFAILPSDNVNHGTKNVIFDTNIGEFVISESGREASGFGFRVGTLGSYSWALGTGQKVSLSGNLSATWYDQPALRHLDSEVGLSYFRETATDLWRFGPYVRGSWYLPPETGPRSDNTAYGVTLSYWKQFPSANSVGIDLRWEQQAYIDKDYLDGDYKSARVTLGRHISPKVNLYLVLDTQFYRPEAEHQAYDDLGLTAGFNNRWKNGITTGLSFGVGKRDFSANFPALSFPRLDDYYSVGFSIQNPKLKIFNNIPQLSCTFKNNISNVAFFDYAATDCQISISRSF